MALCGAHGQTAAETAAALALPGPEPAAEGLRLPTAGLLLFLGRVTRP
jgi:hypothetical protein